MRNRFAYLRRLIPLLAGLAAITTTVVIAPSASADDPCGANQLDDGVYMRACWTSAEDSSGDFQYTTEAKLRIPFALDPNKWSSCEVHVALFIRNPNETTFQERALKKYTTAECLGFFKTMSTSNSVPHYFKGPAFYAQPNYCYAAVTRWFGVYNGSQVGSGVNAESSHICGAAGAERLPPIDDGFIPGTDVVPLVSVGLPE